VTRPFYLKTFGFWRVKAARGWKFGVKFLAELPISIRQMANLPVSSFQGDYSMNQSTLKKLRDLRNQHNQDLIRRMRSGEPLTSFDSKSSWYPPRPTIEKDPKAIEKLYSGKEKKAHDDLGEVS
jgi:hypothetical protein